MMRFSRPKLWGTLLIVMGVFLFLDEAFEIAIPFEDLIIPVVLITVGVSFFLPKE